MTATQSQPSFVWMDEELRKQKEMLAKLRDLVQNQTIIIEDQAGRVRDLQGRLATTQAEMHRISQVEESLQQTKNEMTILLHDFREEQRKIRTQTEEVRRLEREADITTLNRLSQEVDALRRIEKQLESLGAEDHRLHEGNLKLKEVVEELAQRRANQDERISLIDTQRQRDKEQLVRSISDFDALREQLNQHASRLSYLEEWEEKASKLSVELQAFRSELQEDQEKLQGEQRQAELRRQKQVAEWARKMESLSREIEVWSDKMVHFGDQHEKSRKLSRELQELAKQLRYEQEQMKQLQNIAEEQQRRELREWQGGNEKRWNQHLDLWRFHLDKQSKLDLEQTARTDELEVRIQGNREAAKQLAEQVEEDRELARKEVVHVWERLQKTAASLSHTWEALANETSADTHEKPPAASSADADLD